jgi:hypothetical protein
MKSGLKGVAGECGRVWELGVGRGKAPRWSLDVATRQGSHVTFVVEVKYVRARHRDIPEAFKDEPRMKRTASVAFLLFVRRGAV